MEASFSIAFYAKRCVKMLPIRPFLFRLLNCSTHQHSRVLKVLSAFYLRVWELQSGDREDHLSNRHEEILGNLPGHAKGVWLHVQHLLDLLTLKCQTTETGIETRRHHHRPHLTLWNSLRYLVSKRYGGRDEQGVGASEAQALGVLTTVSHLICDGERSPAERREVLVTTAQEYFGEVFSLRALVWCMKFCWNKLRTFPICTCCNSIAQFSKLRIVFVSEKSRHVHRECPTLAINRETSDINKMKNDDVISISLMGHWDQAQARFKQVFLTAPSGTLQAVFHFLIQTDWALHLFHFCY